MSETQPICSLSLDLDNLWSYMKTHGDPGWESFPSYLDLVVPRILEILRRRAWTITFFIVGQDAALKKNREALQAITNAGHEVGNHSFHHEPWLHQYSKAQLDDEIGRAEAAIHDSTDQFPAGFRGPGYSFSQETIEVLADRGYRYDASTFPTYLGPLARAYYFAKSTGLSREERTQRSELFGGLKDGLRPVKPFLWQASEDTVLEIPVTTIPLVKVPFHFSYLLFISSMSPALARLYLRSALTACRLTRTNPSLLLHPLDFLGSEDAPELAFFPAMGVSSRKKLDALESLFEQLANTHRVVPMSAHAEALASSDSLSVRTIRA